MLAVRRFLAAAAASLGFMLASGALADGHPDRVINMVVPNGSGLLTSAPEIFASATAYSCETAVTSISIIISGNASALMPSRVCAGTRSPAKFSCEHFAQSSR